MNLEEHEMEERPIVQFDMPIRQLEHRAKATRNMI